MLQLRSYIAAALIASLLICGCHEASRAPAQPTSAREQSPTPPGRLTNLDLQTVWLPDADLIQVYDVAAPTGKAAEGEQDADPAHEFVLRISETEAIRAPVRRLRELRGEDARRFIRLWRNMEFNSGFGLMCHHPAFAFRTFDKDRHLTFQTSICWGCGNLIINSSHGQTFHGFDSGAPGSQALLHYCEKLMTEPGAHAPGDTGAPAILAGELPRLMPDALDLFEEKSLDATDADLAALRGFSSLQNLGVFGTAITDDGLAPLETLVNLKSLTVRTEHVTNAGIAHLRRLTKLKDLDLSEVKLSDRALDHLASLTSLENLYLGMHHGDFHTSGAARFTDGGLTRLAKLAALRSLALDGTSVSDAGLARLSPLVALEDLSLSGTAVHGTGLRSLKNLQSLKQLYLERCELTEEGLAAIAELPNLEQLHLSDSRGVTETGLAALARCPKLYRLNLRNCRLSDAAVARLRDFPELSHVDLKGNPITDAAISNLAAIAKLNYLWVGETGMTEAWVERLKKMVGRNVIVQQ